MAAPNMIHFTEHRTIKDVCQSVCVCGWVGVSVPRPPSPTSCSSQGVVSRDMLEDMTQSPSLSWAEGGSHWVVPVGMCQ